MTVKAEHFYQRIVEIATQLPHERHALLTRLHTDVVTRYLDAVRAISRQDAARGSSDGRTIAQVVGHIAEWERFTILAAGEMIAGVEWPRIMTMSGYVEPDGRAQDFASVDAFNACQATKHAAWPWERIRDLAVHTATALHALFTEPALLPPERLEQTRACEWHLPNGVTLAVPAGWYLWMVSIKHEAVEHAADLGGCVDLPGERIPGLSLIHDSRIIRPVCRGGVPVPLRDWGCAQAQGGPRQAGIVDVRGRM